MAFIKDKARMCSHSRNWNKPKQKVRFLVAPLKRGCLKVYLRQPLFYFILADNKPQIVRLIRLTVGVVV